MRAFKRLVCTVSTSVESLLDQVENQRAVALATVRDVEAGAARVRVYRRSCERRLGELEQRATQLAEQSATWRERARRFQEEREKALECVRRMRGADAALAALRSEVDQQRALLESILVDERELERKLGELRRRVAQLSTREARAQAHTAAEGLADADGIFDRWEAKLSHHESVLEVGKEPRDAFARELADEDEAAALQAALEDVLKVEGS